MNKKINLKIIKKILFTVLVIAIFILGRNIPLFPIIKFDDIGNNINNSSTLFYISAGSYESITLFSLGISPWMIMLMIFRVFYLYKRKELSSTPKKKINFIQNIIMLLVAILQATSMTLEHKFNFMERLFIILILIAGVFIIVWLGNLNSEHGIGSIGIIVVIGIIYEWSINLKQYISQGADVILRDLTNSNLFYIFVFILISIIFNIILEISYYKIPINRISIYNEFNSRTYLSFKLNPAGAMPFIFAMMIYSLPKYILIFINNILPSNKIIENIIQNTNLNNVFGVVFYIIVLFILSLVFAFINCNPEEIAEKMQKSGDYISGYTPGKATERYLTKIVKNLSYIGAIQAIVFIGLPLLVANIRGESIVLYMIPGMFMMLTALVLNVFYELGLYNIKKRYKNNLL